MTERRLQTSLLRWYSSHRRDLPWRRTRDPYAIWVSEIMLQQTQVATVIPYYERWLRRFPNVGALAAAPPGDVLKAWEGLGYYSRARNLHRAAQQVVREFGGRLPVEPDDLRNLPGIGRYTAGAISSIAFDRDEPVLDGNVIRVYCRLFRIRSDPKSSATQKRLWTLAGDLLPRRRASFYNQALMDLGATICLPRAPKCPLCPVARHCEARRRGEQDVIPARPRRKPVPHFTGAIGVIRHRGRVLIDQRKPEGLLGGLWEFPGGKPHKGESLQACLRREAREELAIRIEVLKPLTTVKHAYSHFRVTLHVFECRYLSGPPKALACSDWAWVRPRELRRYPFPTANRRIIDLIAPGAK